MKTTPQLIAEGSLGQTLVNIQYAEISGRLEKISKAEKTRTAKWIAERHYVRRDYANSFALFEREQPVLHGHRRKNDAYNTTWQTHR